MPPLERSDLQILFPVVALKHVVTQIPSDIEPQRPASICIRVRNQVLSLVLVHEGPWDYLWHVDQSTTRGWGPSWTHSWTPSWTNIFPLKCCCLQLKSPSLWYQNSFGSICKAEQEKGLRTFSDSEQLIALSLYIIFSTEVENITCYIFLREGRGQ